MARTDEHKITLDRERNEHTKRLRQSINKVKWSRSLMQILWTAGPVTSLGLIGGYYLGYGTMPPTQLLIYFVSFTVIAGIFGLVAKVIYDGTRGHLEEQSERDLLSVTDTLGDLILITRDQIVQSYEGDARDREAALQLLRRVDLTPYGVTVAFSDLTGNPEIGKVMGRIFTYRRIGLHTKVQELYASNREEIETVTKELREQSPAAARELKLWFTGHASGRLKHGVPREKYFLQRVMSAIEHQNPHLMTFRDVEEMFILAFELINGREIPTLIFGYSKRWKYAKVLDELELKRSRFRVSQARGGNRLRALAAYLLETGYATREELPDGLEIDQLIAKINRKIDQIAVEARGASKNSDLSSKAKQQVADVLENCIDLYEMAFKGYKEAVSRHKELQRALKDWEKTASETGQDPEQVKVGKSRKGVRIREGTIQLNEEARVEVARHLAWYFRKEKIGKRGQYLLSSQIKSGGMTARRIAIEIAVALEPHIRLSKPEIQRNINATKAIYLGGLSPDMSAVQKQELGQRMAREVDNSLGLAAIRLADTLVNQYHVELSEEAIEFLNYNYNAGRKSLNRVVKQKKSIQQNVQKQPQTPPALKDPKPTWTKSLKELQKRV